MNDSEAGTSGSAMEDFDVFLNHRGPDVKATFVAHLEEALRDAGFRPFLDVRSLLKSDPALKSIDQALAVAKVHVAVVSRGYAESKYCLNELVAMMRTGKPVVPVFYGVKPTDLRCVENGPFAEAFERHKVRGRSERKVQEWRDALGALAGRTGFRSADYKSDEARLKREVVKEVARLTPSNQPVEVDEYRVGLEGPTRACVEQLERMGDGVGLLGLVGMGGVGKTTLAKEIFNHYAATRKFKSMTFLEIHRDPSTSDVQVRPTRRGSPRDQLLWDLLRVEDSGSGYIAWFEKVSTLGPVFIVIDDVHSLAQFRGLIPSFKALSPGSRTVITSRDRSIVNNFTDKVSDYYVHEMFGMGGEDASVLFNLHAFHSNDAPEEYKDVAKQVVEACDGLPLALRVTGSSLFDKRSEGDRETIWVEAVDALRQCEDVMGVLRWSLERLTDSEKLMFMDITCLFNDRCVEEAFAYWESCKDSRAYIGLSTPHTSLRNLILKNLVVRRGFGPFGGLFGRRFWVHGLLRELGQKMARSANRIFIGNDYLMNEDVMGTIGLNLSGCRKRKFKVEEFASMWNLHFLTMPDGCKLNGEFGCMPKKLRVLQWRSMPFESLPKGLSLCLLTSLDLSESTDLASIWTESNDSSEAFPNLCSLNLKSCTSITRLPDSLGRSSQLQYLDLAYCQKFKKLPNFIGFFKSLKVLRLHDCVNLKTLPETIACPYLEGLNLRNCISITKLPELSEQCSQLLYLNLRHCVNLKMLPYSIGQVKSLKILIMDDCTSLETMPYSIGALMNLQILKVRNCTSLLEIPTSIMLLSSLMTLSIGSNLQHLPIHSNFQGHNIGISSKCHSTFQVDHIQVHLKLGVSSQVQSFCQHGGWRSLQHLSLVNHPLLVKVLESIGLLTQLRTLSLRSCARLTYLPNSLGDLKQLERIVLTDCNNLMKLPKTLGALISMKFLIIKNCQSITKLPRSIGLLSQLKFLELKRCTSLQKLPTSMNHLKSLMIIEIEGCGSIEALGALRVLQGVPIWGTTSTTKLPASFRQATHLRVCKSIYLHRMVQFDILGESMCGFSRLYEVLEEDESGVLRGYYENFPGKLLGLLRLGH